MPLYTYIDDIIYDGSETAFKKLVLYSSICAILVLDLEADLIGDPQHFYPRDRTPTNIANFEREYRWAFDLLEPFVTQTSTPVPSPEGSDSEWCSNAWLMPIFSIVLLFSSVSSPFFFLPPPSVSLFFGMGGILT